MSDKTIRYLGEAKDTITRLRLSGASFEVVKTSKTTNVKTAKVNYLFSDKHYFGKIFGLLSSLKSQLNKNEDLIHKTPFSGFSKDVKYFQFSESMRNFDTDKGVVYDIPNVIEADITSAYYRTAFNLGFISQEFYLRAINLDKMDRLILIGSIATIKTVETYTNGILTDTRIEKNDLHRLAWFKICSYVDSALLTLKSRFDAISKDIFLFYWVDGIYFRDFKVPYLNYDYNTVLLELNELFNFEWKIQKMKQFRLVNTGDKLKIELTKVNGDKKTFFPNRNQTKLYYLDKDGKPKDINTDLFTTKLKYK